jgi:hypothetical protein
VGERDDKRIRGDERDRIRTRDGERIRGGERDCDRG